MKKWFCFVLSLLMLLSVVPAFAQTYDELLQKAADYVSSEEYNKALACYDLAIKSEPDNATAYIKAGLLHLDRGNLTAAGESIEKALAADVTSPEAWLAKCRIDLAAEDTAALDADALYAEVCGADLTEYAADFGTLYAKAGNPETAVSYFAQAAVEALNDEQMAYYREALISCGEQGKAAALGRDAAQTRNEKLDAAFDSGSLRLVETNSAAVNPQASDFEFTDDVKALLKESMGIGDIDAALAMILKNTEFGLLSKSPAGNSGLVSAGGTAVSFYNGKYHYVYPSSKGAADEYSNLAWYYGLFSNQIKSLLGEEGIVYSPDGRYAFICNKRITLMQANLRIDPILLDLSTGELILTATYPNKLMSNDNPGAVTSAMFSSDNKYFYYVMFGRFGEARTCLNRYNLSSGETETCFTSPKNLYYPHLAELKDGSILLLNDAYRNDEPESLVLASFRDGTWELKEEKTKLTYKMFYATQLKYSPNAGLACLMGRAAGGDAAVAFQLIRPEKNFDGIDRFWCIRKDTNEMVSISPEEYQESIAADLQGREEGKSMQLSPLYPYQTILNAVFSPDGHYLLVNAINNSKEGRSRNLFLIRLDDMALRKVSGLNAEKIRVLTLGLDYPMNIEWNTDELIIGTDDGIKTFTFTEGQ